MAGMPLPALDIKPPQIVDPVTQFARMQQFQQGQQQLQAGRLENQQRQMDIQSQQAFMRAYQEAQGDPDQTAKLAASYGAKPTALLQWQQQVTDAKLKAADLVAKQGDQAKIQADLVSGAHDTVMAAAPQDRPVTYQSQVAALQKRGIDVSQFPQQYPGDDQFKLIGAVVKTHSQLIDEAAKNAETAKNTAQGQEATNQAALSQVKLNLVKNTKPGDYDNLIDTVTAGNPNLNWRTKGMVNFALSRGDIETANKNIAEMSSQLGAIEKETNPAIQAAKLHLAMATKAAEQSIADGDPKAAAQLLVDGTVAPSQLISSRKPAFAQQAFTAAAQMSPGWNAQKAEGDFKVASSPNNVAFFGSAKSLTDKGGTLDQLADAAKDIPGGRIPVFNSIADAAKAATGSGPIAKYASILLGAGDDYSKVMGGGQGSDTSRTQALKLVPANASPAARAASIEGIRGAVMSQINSRIGNNSVLQKMYGVEGGQSATPSGPPAGATMTVPGSDGKMHWSDGKKDLGVVTP